MLSKGLVAPHGHAAERLRRRARRRPRRRLPRRPRPRRRRAGHGAALVVGSEDAVFAAQLARVLKAAGFDAATTADVVGVELAGAAKNAAALAAAAAGGAARRTPPAPPPARSSPRSTRTRAARGARPETFAGLAGAGDLVATVVAPGSRNRRAGELLGTGHAGRPTSAPRSARPPRRSTGVPLLAATLRREGVPAPTLERLAAVVDGRIDPAALAAGVTAPGGRFQRSGREETVLAAAGSGATGPGARRAGD